MEADGAIEKRLEVVVGVKREVVADCVCVFC